LRRGLELVQIAQNLVYNAVTHSSELGEGNLLIGIGVGNGVFNADMHLLDRLQEKWDRSPWRCRRR